MLCCLDPNCQNPLNPDRAEHCFSCGTKLVSSLGDRYRPVYPLASGGSSQIFLAQDKNIPEETYLVQQLALPASNQYHQISAYLPAKAERLTQIGQHPQISSLSAYFTQGGYFYLVQPTISEQTLRQELMQAGAFSEQQI